MGVSDRWVRTLLERMSKQGDAVVVHGLRGRPSNRKLPTKTQRQAMVILEQPEWHDLPATPVAPGRLPIFVDIGPRTPRGSGGWGAAFTPWERDPFSTHRSEEHTSELQSLRHLVCR